MQLYDNDVIGVDMMVEVKEDMKNGKNQIYLRLCSCKRYAIELAEQVPKTLKYARKTWRT